MSSGRRVVVVAVDGPSGSGKSTVSRRLAQALDASYLDTGAMDRAAPWAVLHAGVDLGDHEAVIKGVGDTDIFVGTEPTRQVVTVNGTGVEQAIRGNAVTAAVSAVSAIPGVRQVLVARQKQIIVAAGRIVVEGRDI